MADEKDSANKSSSNMMYKVIIGILAFIIVAAGAYYIGTQMQDTIDDEVVQKNSNVAVSNKNAVDDAADLDINDNDDVEVEDSDVNEDDVDDSDEVVSSGITWLSSPEEVPSIDLFGEAVSPETVTFYKIADLPDDGELFYTAEATMGTAVARFRKDKDDQYYLLANHSGESYVSRSDDYLNSYVTIDTVTEYEELAYPDELAVAGLELAQKWPAFNYNGFFDTPGQYSNYTYALPEVGTIALVGSTDQGDVYEYDREMDTNGTTGAFKIKKYYLVLADTSVVIYLDKVNFLADDNSLVATLNTSGSDLASQSYNQGIVGDCGSPGGDQYVSSLSRSALLEVGTSPSGDPLYALTDGSHELFDLAYDSYSVGREAADMLTRDEFVEAMPLLLWQDNAGDYLVFMNSNYAAMVECGKPVVYLYPEEITKVKVAVAADVKVSEPDYGTGWTVTAEPNGDLVTVQGEAVDSLFWEGTGQGEYPEITTGLVVPRTRVKKTIREDLRTIGFNKKEIADFMEFWIPRMPHTPFVRMSWFSTQEMNELAPLTVTPRPDTVIRTFLDFEGQFSPKTSLQPQILESTDRAGFTVTEWGGLLIGEKL